MRTLTSGRRHHGWQQRGARDIDALRTAVMRALRALGYDAQPLDYDGRFIDALRERKPEVVFIALHGPGGEDGHVQALLDYLAIPYTGSGLEASR